MSNGTYRALVKLKIGGSQASPDLIEDILQVTVEESLHVPAMFVLVIKNDYFPGRENEQAWKHQDLMEIGKEIDIGFVSSTTESTAFSEEKEGYIFSGEITAIETHFTERSQAPIVIRGYDVSHRLHRGRWNRSFQNMTDSDIVKKLAGEAGIQLGNIDNSGTACEYLFQQNQTNMEFLRERAARLGFELFVSDGKLNFRKPKQDQKLQLKWLKDIQSFRVRVSSAEQVKEVEVRAWDYKTKKPIVSKATGEKLLTETGHGQGSSSSTQFKGKPNNPTLRIVDRPVSCAKEADTMAQALFDELSGQFVYADARAEGNPEIRPGRVIELQDMGKHDGDYYITETRHTYFERIYQTEFSVRGLRSGSLLDTLSPPQQLLPGQTSLVGIVTNNQDPDGLGRVKVKFPSLTEDHESQWARVVSVGAGKQRGLDCLPEVDDEVLVAFEHGDVHRPYVLGGLWNGQDAPPEDVSDTVVDGKVRLRTLRTTSGHQLQFVEEDKNGSKAGVHLTTTGGHEIHLNDSDTVVEIKTSGGHRVTLDDGDKRITLKSSQSITLDAPGEITLKTPSGSLTIGMSGIDIQAGGIVTVKGSLIQLN
ncbi:VgrG-related protein [Baaleninema sp.]|uniref:VgrG-related protein n=1 Tax=Baaleninema sp. TaxID=3101197 RepID=UPI003D07ECE0